MSLLEDVFLEDEAGEAQELERVIEGDEYDERPLTPNSDNNEEKDDEAEEDKRRVDPNQGKTKRVVKNPRFILNPARLTGPRGIQVIPDHFKDFKFKGKGHEKDDLDMVLKKLEHWAYRLYPKFGFHDCLKKIEMLGKKRTVMVHLTKIRSDQLVSDDAVVQKDSSEDEAEAPVQEDEFDKLLQQQIDLARSTPAPGSVKKAAFSTPSVDRSIMMPKATSSPSISDEQRERMLRNRRLAEERRLAKLRNETATETDKGNNQEAKTKELSEEVVVRKHNRSHIIASSDDEEPTINQVIPVDVHNVVHEEIESVVSDNDTLKQKTLKVTPEIDATKDDELIPRKHRKLNSIGSSDEDELNFKENDVVNVESKSKVDEDSISEVKTKSVNSEFNEVVAQKSCRSDVDSSSNMESLEVGTIDSNLNKMTHDASNNTKNDINPMNTTKSSTSLNPGGTEVSNKDSTFNSSESSKSKNIDIDIVVNESNIGNLNSTKNNEINESNEYPENNDKANNEIIDNVMDVDFSEDF